MSIKHVALVGETGRGKSRLVNLLTGENCAKENNDVEPCIDQAIPYPIKNASGVECTLWDTRGWNEALEEEEATGPIARFLRFLRRVPDAERKLQKFLRSKDRRISLILFCIAADKIGGNAEWKHYKKIFVKMCKRKIKVGVVVTRMDSNRDTKWKRLAWVRYKG